MGAVKKLLDSAESGAPDLQRFRCCSCFIKRETPKKHSWDEEDYRWTVWNLVGFFHLFLSDQRGLWLTVNLLSLEWLSIVFFLVCLICKNPSE